MNAEEVPWNHHSAADRVAVAQLEGLQLIEALHDGDGELFDFLRTHAASTLEDLVRALAVIGEATISVNARPGSFSFRIAQLRATYSQIGDQS